MVHFQIHSPLGERQDLGLYDETKCSRQTPGSLGKANEEQDFTNNRVRMVKASGKMDSNC